MSPLFRTRRSLRNTRNFNANRLNKSPRVRLMLQALEERAVPATFTVNVAGDTGLVGQLRERVALANASLGADTINFDNTVFTSASTITLGASGFIAITEDLTITGIDVGGSASMSISGGATPYSTLNKQLFTSATAGVSVAFENISLTNAYVAGAGAVVGGLTLTSSVTFTNSVVASNSASGNGGILSVGTGFSGTITIVNSSVTGNKGSQGGGFYFFDSGNLNVSSSTFSGNTATGGDGGAIYGHASFAGIISSSTFTNNVASAAGGAIAVISGTASSLDVSSCTFTGNTAAGGGAVHAAGVATITASTFTNNTSSSSGGAVRGSSSLTITSSKFTGNTANGAGGAVYSSTGLTATSVSFTNNTAVGAGGAVRSLGTNPSVTFAAFTSNTAGTTGGGLHNSGSTFTLTNATFSGNTSGSSGGGVYTSGNTVIHQITISKNTAAGAAGGGGFHASTSSVTINNSTLYDNTASGSSTASSGAGLVRTSGTLVVNSTIIAGNKVTGSGTRGRDIFSTTTVTLAGNDNLIGTNDNSSITWTGVIQKGTNATPINPLVAAVSDQGGFLLPDGSTIKTVGLLAGSPALEKGNNNSIISGNDQRDAGFLRTLGLITDVGAFEGVVTKPIATLTSAPNVPAVGTVPYTFDVTYVDDSGFDTTSFTVDDVIVNGAGYGGGQKPTSRTIAGGGNTYVITYTIPAPPGGWGKANAGTYSVTMIGSEVSDDSANFVGAGALGSFKTGFVQTLMVDIANDVDNANYNIGDLSFREAIKLSNINSGNVDSITFDTTVFNAATTVTLSNGVQSITDSVNITGPAAALTFDAAKTIQQITVSAGQSLTMSNLTFSNFSANAAGAAFTMSSGSLSLNSVTFSGNTSTGGTGGAVAVTGTATVNITSSTFSGNTATGTGAGLRVTGASTTLNVSSSTFSGNTSSSTGGAVYAGPSTSTSTINASSFTNNTGSGGGGAIRLLGNATLGSNTFTTNTATGTGGALSVGTSTVTVTGSTFTGNTASSSGSAMYAASAATVTTSSFTNNRGGTTGAVHGASSLTLTSDTFTTNTAATVGGAVRGAFGLNVASSTFSGNTAGTLGGAVYTSGSATIANSTFTSNTAASNGGAIRNATTLTLTNSTFTGNTSNGTAGGGAIYAGGSLNASTVVFTNNRALNAAGSGGAIRLGTGASTITFAYFDSNTAAGSGGGLSLGVVTTLANSTFFNNSAAGVGGALNQTAGSLFASQSTFNKNTSSSLAGGGAINLNAAGTIALNSVTIYDNTASGAATANGGAGILRTSGSATVTINSSIVAGNKRTGTGTKGIDIFSLGGNVTIAGNDNIIGTNDNSSVTFSGTGNQIGVDTLPVDPGLGALQNNGGVVLPDATTIQTMLPGLTSIARDKGSFPAFTALSAGASAGDTTIGVVNAAGTFIGGFIQIDSEIMLITGVSGNTLTVTRAQASTTANTHIATALVRAVYDQRHVGFPRVRGKAADVGAVEAAPNYIEASLVGSPSVPSAGSADFQFQVAYFNSNGKNIDTSTFDLNDLLITGNGFGAGVLAKSMDTFSGAGNAYSVTYTVAAPTVGFAGWGGPNIGSYGVTMQTGQVLDVDTLAAEGAVGNFKTAFGSSLVVDNTGDGDDSNYAVGQLTFREALRLSNENGGFTDTISFDTTAFGGAVTTTIAGTAQSFIDSVVVNGPTAPLTMSGGLVVGKTFVVANGINVSLSKLNFTSFTATAAGGVFSVGSSTFTVADSSFVSNRVSSTGGGAIAVTGSSASITLTNDTFSFNTATGTGGAIHISGTSVSLNVSGSAFSGNTSSSAGGAIRGAGSSTFNVATSTFTGNTSSGTGGGALYFSGAANTISLTSDTFGTTGAGNGNTASSAGGAVFIATSASTTVNVSSTTFTNNSSASSGGALRSGGSVTIGSSMFSGSTGTLGAAMYLAGSTTATISSSTIQGGTSTSSSAGVYLSSGVLTISKSLLQNNTSSSTAGALFTSGASTVSINQTKFHQNRGTSAGAIVHSSSATTTIDSSSFSGNVGTSGRGAMYFSSGGLLTVSNSTFFQNTASSNGGAFTLWSASAEITNSTFNNNVAADGGAIRVSSSTAGQFLRLNNTTVAGNTGTAGSGGIVTASSITLVTLESTIVAANIGTVEADINTPAGVLISGDNNLIGAQGVNWTATGALNQIGPATSPLDPGLFAIGDNDGYVLVDGTFVRTMALKGGSIARDAGNNKLSLTYDQRGTAGLGHPRTLPTLGKTDVGAYEADPIPGASAVAGNVTIGGGATFDVTVTYKGGTTTIKTSTIDPTDITVIGAFDQVTLNAKSVVFDDTTTVNTVFATYTFDAPDDAVTDTWDNSDTDLYFVNLTGVVENSASVAIPTGNLTNFVASISTVAMTVDKTGDLDDGNFSVGNLTIREAVRFSNLNVGNTDTISFDTTVFNGVTTTLTSGAGGVLALADPVSIAGPGKSKLAISGDNSFQIFNVNLPTLGAASISGLTLTNGNSLTGGAIQMTDDSLTLDGVDVKNSTASGSGGGIAMTSGVLTFKNGTISGNTATGSGAGIFGGTSATITIIDSTLQNNTSNSSGGAIFGSSSSAITVDPSIIMGNRATTGAAILASFASTVTIDQSLITQNVSSTGRGAVDMSSSGSLTVIDSTFSSNTAATAGGAIAISTADGTITNSTFSGNTAGTTGGAIAVTSSVALQAINIYNTTISGNTAGAGAGGISTSSTVTTTLIQSTIVAANTGTTSADIVMATGTAFGGGDNLIGVQHSSWTAGGTNQIGDASSPLDPGLNPLSNLEGGNFKLPDGNFIPVMSLKPGSLAYDSGSNPLTLTYDQRGGLDTTALTYARTKNGGGGSITDVGAYEADKSPIPTAKLTTFPDITGATTVPYEFKVTYTDDSGFDTTTFDGSDVVVSGPGYTGSQTVTLTNLDSTGAPSVYVATYKVSAPTVGFAGWGGVNIGKYTVTMQAGQVSDDSTNFVPGPGSLAPGFKTAFATTVLVDLESDADDSLFGPGQLTLREALRLTNGNTGLDTINFDSTAFTGTPIIVATTMGINDNVLINGPGKGLLKLDGNNLVQIFNINVAGTGTVTVSGMTLQKGRAATGGAVQMTDDSVSFSSTDFTLNTATAAGGGAFALTTGTLSLTSTTFNQNTATGAGGAIVATGAGSITVSASTMNQNSASGSGGAISANASNVTIQSGSTLSNNTAAVRGGALAFGAGVATFSDSLITGNRSSGNGGAIYQEDVAGSVTITYSTFSNNTATAGHGGFYSDGSASDGNHAITIENSLVSGNSASSSGGAMYFWDGGVLNIRQSTFSGNKSSGDAGAIDVWNISGSVWSIHNSTFTNNTSSGAGGALGFQGTPTIDLISSILAGNFASTAATSDTDAAGELSGTDNIIGVLSATLSGSPNYTGVATAPLNPGLDGLSNNGGKSNTHALKVGSPALNKGSDPDGINSSTAPFDQRGPGFPRVLGGTIDIGANEGVSSVPQVSLLSAPNITTANAGQTTYQFTVVYSDNVEIDQNTIKLIPVSDVTVTGPGIGSPFNPTAIFIDPGSTKTSVTVTYTIDAPGLSFDSADNGTYTITMNALQVSDKGDSGPVLSVPTQVITTYKVGVGATYLVDELILGQPSDVDDSVFTAGNLSLREALRLANTVSVGSGDIINFVGGYAGTLLVSAPGYTIVDEGVTINGPGAGALIIDGTGSTFSGFNIDLATPGGVVEISGLKVTNFSTTGSGGAINNQDAVLTLKNMVLHKNTAATSGGGVNLGLSGSSLTATNTVFSENTATSGDGGAIFATTGTTVSLDKSSVRNNLASSTSSDGGGIFMNPGILTINTSTLSGNRANNTFASFGGGAMYLNGATTTTITNSTLSGNTSAADGGAIHADDPGTLNIRNTTIANNSAALLGGGIDLRLSGNTVNIYSSIIAGNAAGTSGPDISGPTGTVVNIEVSNISNSANITTLNQTGINLVDVDPLLDPLSNYGGFTLSDGTTIETHRLKTASPVINGGGNTIGLNFDQRDNGFARSSPIAAKVDMGAFELQVAQVKSAYLSDASGLPVNHRSLIKTLVITFSAPVNYASVAGFTLSRSGTSTIPLPVGNVGLIASPPSSPPGGVTSVTMTFAAGPLTEFGSLIDGLYNLTIDDAQVTSNDNAALDGNADNAPGDDYVVNGTISNLFFRYFGDFANDQTPSPPPPPLGPADGALTQYIDFIEFRNAFTSPSIIFDFDNSGTVDQPDFIKFRNNFGGAP